MTDVALSMDRMYRHQRHIYDLTRKYYLLGRDRLIDRLDAGPGSSVLEIGCGTGRNLLRAAQCYPDARFFGVDISRQMLASAEQSIARAKLTDRVSVAFGDATDFDPTGIWQRETFDRIFISYSLSMIPPWHDALRHAVSLLAPAGQLHIVDFGGQEGLPTWFRRGLRGWLDMFQVWPRDHLEAELRACAHGGIAFERPYRGYAQRAVLTARAS